MDTIALPSEMKQHAFRPEESNTVNLLFWLQRCYPFFLLNNDGNQKKTGSTTTVEPAKKGEKR